MDNNYIINKRCRLNNNNITQTFSQENIIQKRTFEIQLQTMTTTSNPRNKTQTTQLQHRG